VSIRAFAVHSGNIVVAGNDGQVMFFDEDGGEEMTFDYTKDSDAVVKFGNAVRAVSTLFTLLRLETNYKRSNSINYRKLLKETSMYTFIYRLSVISLIVLVSRFSFTCICSFCIVAINIQTVHYTNHLTRRN